MTGYDQNATSGSAAPATSLSYSSLYSEDKRALRTKIAVTGIVLLVFIGISLCVDPSEKTLISPIEVISCYGYWFNQMFLSISDPTHVASSAETFAVHESYYRTMTQLGVTFITVVSGMLLALAGTLYQHVFRNPIASPTMLGVSSGINLGIAVLVLVFGTAASQMLGMRYLFTYGFVIIALFAIFLFGVLMGGKGRQLNVVNLLLVGTIINQLIGVFVTYITWYVFSDEDFDVYNYISESLGVDTSWLSLLLIGIACLVAVVPIYLLRFRMNALSFDDKDMKMLGINPFSIRLIALICGTIMIVSAQIHTGTVAMVSLVVPFISRFLFGAEFSKQFWGNILLGAALLLFCRLVLLLLPMGLTSFMGVGVIVNFVAMPVFVWMIATQQRSWE